MRTQVRSRRCGARRSRVLGKLGLLPKPQLEQQHSITKFGENRLVRQDIMVPQNRPTKLDFWYFFTFVCCNACSVGDFTKISNFVNHFCVSRSYKNRPHFCSTKLAYKKTDRPFTTAVLQFFGIIFWVVQPHRLTVDGSHVKKRPPKDGTQFFESKF
jgi:hypothetical protein